MNTHNFVKNDPNLEIRACFMKNFMELDMKKKKLNLRAVKFGVWGLKTSLRQFGFKRFIKS